MLLNDRKTLNHSVHIQTITEGHEDETIHHQNTDYYLIYGKWHSYTTIHTFTRALY